MKKINRNLLIIGSFQTIVMSTYHFFIPYQYKWGSFISGAAETINWALFGLNNYFSFNLLVVSLALYFHLKYRSDKEYTIKVLSIITLLFWFFSVIYQIIEPMPLPNHLSWIRSVLIGLAILNTIIFVIPLKMLLIRK